jgi:putative phosphoesterase
MRLAIISDTHDNLATLDKFLAYIKDNPVDTVIHCGDIASGETLERLAKGFGGQILAAFGNMDYRESVKKIAKKYPEKIKLFENFGSAEFNNVKIGFCHHKETALQYCQNLTEGNSGRFGGKKFDFIFYGHTHKPWLETVNDCQLTNPGTLAGMFYQATFAILDTETKKLDLKIVSRLRPA